MLITLRVLRLLQGQIHFELVRFSVRFCFCFMKTMLKFPSIMIRNIMISN